MTQATVDRPLSPRRQRDRRGLWGIIAVCVVAYLAIVALLFGPQYWKYAQYVPQEGDVIFQSLPYGPIVLGIEGATDSPWSHCGIVARDEQGRWIVYEAYSSVEATPLSTFIYRSRGDRYAVYRFRPEYQAHIPDVLAKVRQYLGRPYDIRYRLDDEAIYCSELIYKAYLAVSGEPLGKLVRLEELHWQPYESLIRAVEQGPVPLDRQVITPRDLAAAPELELLFASNTSSSP